MGFWRRLFFGVELVVDFFEMRVGDVGVDLGRADIVVAEEGLDGAEVGAVHEEVGGKGVAEGVGGDVLCDAGEAGVFFDNALDGAGGETAVVAGIVNGLEIAGIVEKEGGEVVGTDGEVVLYRFGGGVADEDGAVFLALAADGEFAAVEVDGVAVKLDELGDAEAAREEKLENGAVAEAGLGVDGDEVEHGLDFVVVEESDLLFRCLREVNEGGVEGGNFAAGEIAEEAAEGDEVVGLGQGVERVGLGVLVAVEAEAVFSEKFGGDFGGGIVVRYEVGS